MLKTKWKKILLVTVPTLVVFGLVLFLLFWFKSKNTTGNVLKVEFSETIPDAELGVEYDFEPYILKQEDTEYSMTAQYLDDNFEYQDLEVDGFKFTQNELSDVYITVNAKRGELTATGEVTVKVVTNPDPIDKWQVSVWSEGGFTKKLNTDPQYLASEESNSSIKVEYMGNGILGTPLSIFPLLDFDTDKYISVEDWSNAVLTFDVYNPMDEEITFGMLIKHQALEVNTHFAQNPQFVAAPKQWTHVEYSYRSMSVTENFVFDEEFENSDHNIVQVTYSGATEDESAYVYSFYVDNLDICDYDAERFPDLDINIYNEHKDFLSSDDAMAVFVNNVAIKDAIAATKSTEKVSEYSRQSVKITLSNTGKAATAMVHSFIGGNPTGWKPLDITNASLSIDVLPINADNKMTIRFESDYNVFGRDIVIDLGDNTSGKGWTCTKLSNGWYRVSLDVKDADIGSAMVESDFIRCMRMYFSNNAATAGKASVVYLDNLNMTGYTTTPHPLDEDNAWDTMSPYTKIEKDDIVSQDDDTRVLIDGKELPKDKVNHQKAVVSKDSLMALKVTMSENGKKVNAETRFTIGGHYVGWKPIDITNATFSLDVKVVNADSTVVLKFESDDNLFGNDIKVLLGKNTSGAGWTCKELGDGWYRISVIPKNANVEWGMFKLDFVKYLRVCTTNSSATSGESAVYLDNLKMSGHKKTSVKLQSKEPWLTPSPYTAIEDGDLINLTIEQCNMDKAVMDRNVLSDHSAQSLRLEQNSGKEDSIQWSAVFISELNNWKGVDLRGKVISFDLKTENYNSWVGINIEHTEQGMLEGVYFNPTVGAKDSRYECVALSNGWTRVYVYVESAWGDYCDSVYKIMYTTNTEGSNKEKACAINIDNLKLLPGDEKQDASNVYSEIADGSLTGLTFDHSVQYGDSFKSLKLTLTSKNEETWGCADLQIAELTSWKPVNLKGKTISFDVKTVNAGNIGIALETPGYGMSEYVWIDLAGSGDGWSVKKASDGWYRVSMDLDTAFGVYNRSVFKFRFMITNQGKDYGKNTVLYLDNLDIGAFSSLTSYTVDEMNDATKAYHEIVDGVLNEVKIDTSVYSEESLQSLKLGIDAGRGEIWGCADLQIAELTNWKPVNLKGKTITMDVKAVNAANMLGIALETPGYGLSEFMWIGLTGSGEGWSAEEMSDGWCRITMDLDTMYGVYSRSVFKFRIMMTNQNQDYEKDSAIYIDNVDLGEISSLTSYTVDEINDATNAYHEVVDGVLNEVKIDTSVYSEESLQSLKLGINAGRDLIYGCADLQIAELTNWVSVNLKDKTITFDVKAVNAAPRVGIALETPGYGLSEFMWIDLTGSGEGWSVAEMSDGWYRVTMDLDAMYGVYSRSVFKFRIMMTNQNQDYASDSAIYIDNVYLGEVSSLTTYTVDEINDATNAYHEIVDGVLNEVQIDTSVYSMGSLQSLKLVINADRDEVWGCADLQIASLTNWVSVNLAGKTITMDVKAVNAANMLGIALETPGYGLSEFKWIGLSGSGEGWSVETLSDGWCRITMDLDAMYGVYSRSVFKFRIMMTNQNQDYTNASVIYIDNVDFGEVSSLTTYVVDEINDAIKVHSEKVDNVLNTLEKDSSVYSNNSLQSLKLGIDGVSKEVWACVDLFVSELTGWKPVYLKGKTVTFDVKMSNSANFFGVAIEKSGHGLSEFIWVGLDSAGNGWSTEAIADGWYRVTLDLDKMYGAYTTSVFKFRIMITNQGQDQTNATAVYVDNFNLGPVSSLTAHETSESADKLNVHKDNVDQVLNTMVNDGGTCSTENSTTSVKMGIDANRGETWACMDLYVSEQNGWNGVNMTGKTVTFDVKVENSANYFGLSAELSGTGLSEFIWVGLDSNGNGWSTVSKGDGWYAVTIDMDKAFAGYQSNVFKFRFMITNSGQDYAQATAVYLDNMNY
ncbi:MAG: hypothetical protein IJE23_07675 [Tyzzerella sp.]|nr:hypothetical protein [Tyzzerella sp.]